MFIRFSVHSRNFNNTQKGVINVIERILSFFAIVNIPTFIGTIAVFRIDKNDVFVDGIRILLFSCTCVEKHKL